MDEELNVDPVQGSEPPGAPSEFSPEEPQDDVEDTSKRIWLLIGAGAVIVLLAVLALLALLGVFRKEPEQPVSAEPFITITYPEQGAVVPVPETVTVQGQAGGLFENNLVVQALDENGNLLAQQPTTVDTTEIGGTGNWSTEIVIPVKPGTKGLIFAFSTSPQDGSIVASASVEVTYGEEKSVSSQISISEPEDGETLDLSKPVTVKGLGEGLFEGNVVVQALDEGEKVIVERPTTMSTDEPGGAGKWSVELEVDVTPGSIGAIRAYSPSPEDGSVMAEDKVSVTYGGEEVEPTAPPATEAPPTELPPGSELIGPTWTVEMILPQISQPQAGVVQDLEEPIEDTTVSLVFIKGGTIEGSGGCNAYTGHYTVTATDIAFSDLTVTRVVCDDPPGVMEQETHYFALLEQAEKYYAMQQGDEQTLVFVEVREDENNLEQPLLEYKDK